MGGRSRRRGPERGPTDASKAQQTTGLGIRGPSDRKCCVGAKKVGGKLSVGLRATQVDTHSLTHSPTHPQIDALGGLIQNVCICSVVRVCGIPGVRPLASHWLPAPGLCVDVRLYV